MCSLDPFFSSSFRLSLKDYFCSLKCFEELDIDSFYLFICRPKRFVCLIAFVEYGTVVSSTYFVGYLEASRGADFGITSCCNDRGSTTLFVKLI